MKKPKAENVTYFIFYAWKYFSKIEWFNSSSLSLSDELTTVLLSVCMIYNMKCYIVLKKSSFFIKNK